MTTPRVKLLRRELRHHVVGAADLERATGLQALALQQERAARERAHVEQRRDPGDRAHTFGGALDVVESDHSGRIINTKATKALFPLGIRGFVTADTSGLHCRRFYARSIRAGTANRRTSNRVGRARSAALQGCVMSGRPEGLRYGGRATADGEYARILTHVAPVAVPGARGGDPAGDRATGGGGRRLVCRSAWPVVRRCGCGARGAARGPGIDPSRRVQRDHRRARLARRGTGRRHLCAG